MAKPAQRVVARPSQNTLNPSNQGRDNPFALSEQQQKFEVRWLEPSAPAPTLPPIPTLGLGSELGGASLSPPAAPDVVIPFPAAAPVAIIQANPVTPPPAQAPERLPLSPVIPAAESPAPVSPTALAEAVEIQGVVQLSGQSAVIVKDSAGALSRTVQPGARLAGGQVELLRIETTTAEPQVVLMQNGIEVVRGIGV